MGFEFEIENVEVKAYLTTNDPNIMGKALETGKQLYRFAETTIKERKLPEKISQIYFEFDKQIMEWRLEGGIRQEPWGRFLFDHHTGKWSEES